MIKKNYDLVVIGGGSAGMAGAIEARKLGIQDILIIEKNDYLGGILNQCVHNGFGLTEFKEELTGPEFMTRLSDQVKELKIDYVLNTTVTSLLPDKTIYASNQEGFYIIKAKSVLVTTGCYERNAGAIMLPGDRPSGVVTAGTAQLYLNIYGYLVGKRVFILGSGDIGLIMARRLTLEGAKVLGVAELCPYSNGLNRNIVQCLEDFHIPLYLSHTVSDVDGYDGILHGITISQVDEHNQIIPGTEKKYECDTLLLSVGLIPNSPLLRDAGVKLSRNKGAIVNERYETSIPGVFSAGNVLHVHDLVDLVTKESRLVAHFIKEYLDGKESAQDKYLDVIASDGVGYVLPHKVSLNNTHDVTFKFRVRKPIKDLNVIFLDKDSEIKKIFKPVLIPSEMTEITLTSEELKKFKNNITVKVEKKI
ncbi:MAG: NAD(P)/FAD-dependent oxidoreductase [Bacilli bacterium]|nr:NAD(P)/FAD-dependent oxidoreductase [Bacilli bacterium]